MRRLVLTLGFTAILSGSLGCEVEEPDAPADEQTKVAEKPILGGSPDTTHDAVVLLLSEQGSGCTGTIIATNGSTGYVLTAGHCGGMDYVIMDDDTSCLNNNSCDAIWAVEEQIIHPNFNGNAVDEGYDFSMIRFLGANGSTPVIAAATSPDGVSVGTMTEMVGYGLTENGETNLRMHVTQPVDQLDSFFLAWDQMGGTIGTCSGDSGGPALFNGRVVAVTSFGDQNCQQIGVSGRVTLVYNDFIAPFIGAAVVETCDTCFGAEVNTQGGDCFDELDACFTPETSQCAQLVQCFNDCATQACYDGCADDHPGGITQYNAIIDCGCTACATLCADECGSGSTTITAVSSGNGIMGTGGAMGAGGEGSGATSGDGGSSNNDGGSGGGDGSDEGASGPCDCATAGSNGGAPNGAAFGFAALALALGVARRRRR